MTELASHFFRNIHNQIKQQVGKPVRETVLSVPSGTSDEVKARLREAAQAGGIRIKSFIEDNTASLLAYGIHLSPAPAMALVLDIGWSRTQVSIFSVSGGAIVRKSELVSEQAAGRVFVKNVAEHCAKEFLRKAKFPCTDNARSMLRLRRESEAAVKAMSTGAEATIDIDSLCEGVDFSCKISRARFEDLCSTGFAQIKSLLNDALTAAGLESSRITHVCVSGGLSAIPRVGVLVKSLLPDATFPKVRLEPSEAQSTGAAVHANDLSLLGLLDTAPSNSPKLPCLKKAVFLSGSVDGPLTCVVPSGSILPCMNMIQANASVSSSYLRVLLATDDGGSDATLVGELVLNIPDGSSLVDIQVEVGVDGGINVAALENKTMLTSHAIPSK